MAKRICRPPGWLGAPNILDIYSVSDCVNENFADYINFWKHNGYWLFDSPEGIAQLAGKHSLSLAGTHLFYYEAFENEFLDNSWRSFLATPQTDANVIQPSQERLEGYDVITVQQRSGHAPDHSPLSCSALAKTIYTNSHCLFENFERAEASIDKGDFNNSEPGALRIIAVYSVGWPHRLN